MIKEALQYLISLARPETVEVDGRTYSTGDLNPVIDPAVDTLGVTTLSALIGYIEADCDALIENGEVDRLTAHVVSPTCVRLYAPADGSFKTRPEIMEAKPLLRDIPFGRFISGEEMVILLQTCFERNVGDWAKVVAVAGNVTAGSTRDYTDDGVSQAVTAKVGVASKADVVMPNPVLLAPFRTFPEVSQPISQFVFRAKSNGPDAAPTFALFEADGGAWRNVAMAEIADWLQGAAERELAHPAADEVGISLNVIY